MTYKEKQNIMRRLDLDRRDRTMIHDWVYQPLPEVMAIIQNHDRYVRDSISDQIAKEVGELMKLWSLPPKTDGIPESPLIDFVRRMVNLSNELRENGND